MGEARPQPTFAENVEAFAHLVGWAMGEWAWTLVRSAQGKDVRWIVTPNHYARDDLAALLAAYWLYIEDHNVAIVRGIWAETQEVFRTLARWAMGVPALRASTSRVSRVSGGQRITTVRGAHLVMASVRSPGALYGLTADRLIVTGMPSGLGLGSTYAAAPRGEVWRLY